MFGCALVNEDTTVSLGRYGLSFTVNRETEVRRNNNKHFP